MNDDKAGLGIAGLDKNLRLDEVDRMVQAAGFGIAGVNCHSLGETVATMVSVASPARCGIAGEIPSRHRQDSLALFGIAGNPGTTVARPAIEGLGLRPGMARELRAEQQRLERACLFPDVFFVVTKSGRLRFRRGRERLYAPGQRRLPVILDSAAYRAWSTAQRLAAGKKRSDPIIEGVHRTPERYQAAIDLIAPGPVGNVHPLGAMAYDFIDDPDGQRTRRMYRRFCADGYPVIPILPIRAYYDPALTPAQNAAQHARHPDMRYYTGQARLVAIGGLVKGPVPRDQRIEYIAALCAAYPDHYFWWLGQANYIVLNGLRDKGLLDQNYSDGTWWIADAVCQRIPVVQQGYLKMIKLARDCQSFFTTGERMRANLRSILAMYAGQIEVPHEPTPKPADGRDPAAVRQLALGFQQDELYQDLTRTPLTDQGVGAGVYEMALGVGDEDIGDEEGA
ncbi:MAG: hypothetical protein KKA73_09340 [Chloroflexi bacterium]|nr:hypothetical protein [Chloroflexota bacterium]